MDRSIRQGWATLVDAQVKRGKSLTSGRRRQFAALYPNADEPGHRLNSQLRARLTEFACIHQQRRDLLVCTVEFENKTDENLSSFLRPLTSACRRRRAWLPRLGAVPLRDLAAPRLIGRTRRACLAAHHSWRPENLGRNVRTSDTGDLVFRIHRSRISHTVLCRL